MTSRLVTGILQEDSKTYSKFLLEDFNKLGIITQDREKLHDLIEQRYYRLKFLLRYAGMYEKEASNLLEKCFTGDNDKAFQHLISCLATGVEKFRQSIKQELPPGNHPKNCYYWHAKSKMFNNGEEISNPEEITEETVLNEEFVASFIVISLISSQKSPNIKPLEEKVRKDLARIGKTPDWINKTIAEAKGIELNSYRSLIEALCEVYRLEEKANKNSNFSAA